VITIKSSKDFEKMAIAGEAVASVLDAVKDAATAGVRMKDLDALAAEIIRAHDCLPSFLGYHGFPAHICTSPNDVIVHGIPDGHRLREGDILSIDAGAIYEGWHADAAVTFPIGRVSSEVERLLAVTERALWAGIAEVRPGARLGDIGHAVEELARPAGLGVVREYVGHGIGRQMHEEPQVPNYGPPDRGPVLRKGMALALEPMVNVGDWRTRRDNDNWTVSTLDGSLSAHFEHTIAITDGEAQVLTLP